MIRLEFAFEIAFKAELKSLVGDQLQRAEKHGKLSTQGKRVLALV